MKRILHIFICIFFISFSIFGQENKECKELLEKEISSTTFSENIDEFVVDLQTLINCKFDEIDLQIFMGPNGDFSFIASSLIEFAGKSNKKEKYTFENLKQTLQSIKDSPEYLNIVQIVEAQNTLIKKNASIKNWETDKQLLNKMGLAGEKLTDFYSIIESNENKPYSEIFLIYSDTLSARTERQLIANENKISEIKNKNPEAIEWVKGLLAYNSYDLGLKKSKESNKPMLLYFNGYACVNARKIEEYILTDNEIQDYINSNLIFVNLLVDDRKELEESQKYYSERLDKEIKTTGQKNTEFQINEYQANSQPLFILLDLNGNEISRIGYTRDIIEFSKFIKKDKK